MGKPAGKSQTPIAQRDANGRAAPGNTLALRHGLRSDAVRRADLPEQAESRARVAGVIRDVLADLGGVDNTSAVERELVRRLGEVSVIGDYLAAQILRDGVLSGKGRQRAVVSAYLATVDRIQRLAHAVGLQRRPKPVTDLETYVADRYAVANAQTEDGHGA